MDRAAFTAMTGAKYAVDLLGVTSNNLANGLTAGFREQLAYFRSAPLDGEGAPTRTFAVGWTPYAKLSAGVLEHTGNPYNAAIDGSGWFVAKRPDGTEAMTRDGSFKVIDGVLSFSTGFPVVGVDGPIAVPAGGALAIDGDGLVSVKFPTNPVTVQQIGRIKVVNPPTRTLLRDTDGLFTTTDKPVSALKEDPAVNVRGGVLESSNVNTANLMIQIISQTRAFDMNMKVVQTVSENDKAANSLLSRAR